MNFLTNLRVYLKFLSRNKLYTAVSIIGFSISLMFVILLTVYVQNELSVDDFQEKKDRIFLMAHGKDHSFGNPVAPYVKNKCPEVEEFVRVLNREVAIGKRGEDRRNVGGMFADSTFFKVFSYKLIEGSSSTVLAANKSVVLTESLARERFADADPIGKSIIIGEEEYNVTGIMEDMPKNSILAKSDFIASYTSITQFWQGVTDKDGKPLPNAILEQSNNFGFTMFFLEKEGANLPAKTEMLLEDFKKDFWFYKNGFADRLDFYPLKDAYFETNGGWGGAQLKSNNKTTITLLSAIALLILVIATLNYINMTVAQSTFRGKESAIKKLLGCQRKSIMRQILLESFFMTCITFLIGLFLAFLVESTFNDLLSTKLELKEHINVLNIFLALAFVCTISLCSGLAPALIISGFNPIEVVKGGLRRKVKTTYSKILIVFQFTVAISLLICSYFITEQANYMLNYDEGIKKDRVLLLDNALWQPTQVESWLSEVRQIPGVELVSQSQGHPFGMSNNQSFEVDGQQFSFQELRVDKEFMEIYGIHVTPTGVATKPGETMIFNQKAMKALNVDTVTYKASFGVWEDYLIEGVVEDFHVMPLFNGINPLKIEWIREGQSPWCYNIKIADNAELLATTKAITELYKKHTNGEEIEPQFVTERTNNWYKGQKQLGQLLSLFTILTIIITIMGVFAMSLYLVQQKEREIGLRRVNGATQIQIMGMLNWDSLKRVIVSFLIACPISYYVVDKWLESYPLKIEISVWGFLLAGISIAVLTALSVAGMTWKAARTNPIEILKSE